MSFWRLAARNLGRARKRNFATGSAIAFGFAGILLLAAYAYRARNYIRVYTVYVVHTGHIVVYAPGGFAGFTFQPGRYSLSAADQAKVRAAFAEEPDVELVEAQIRGQGLVGNGCLSFPFVAQGFEPSVDRELRAHPQVKEWMPTFHYLLAGRGLADYAEDLGPVMLSRGLALALGKTRLHDDFPSAPASFAPPDCTHPRAQGAADASVQLLAGSWAGQTSAADGEAVGLYTTGVQESDGSGLIASVARLQKLFDTERVTDIAAWLRHPESLRELKERVRARLPGFDVLAWDEERLSPYYVGTVDFLSTIVLAGALVLSAIIALSVLNSTTMTILERSQEIGMYRAMGFTRGHVRRLYVLESLLLAALALAAGAGLGIAAIHAINGAEIIYHPPGIAGGLTLRLVLPPGQAALVAALILALVTLATHFAVSRRLKPTPADLLGGTLR